METIGVLALQGAFALHQQHIEACGAKYKEVLTEQDLLSCDKLILPGGESTTMLKLIEQKKLFSPLKRYLINHHSWGICAGAILLAKNVENPTQKSFEILDITISRNGYGRQINSYIDKLENYEVFFIRAPKILRTNPSVTITHRDHKDQPLAVAQGKVWATTFHPELNSQVPSPWHLEFAEKEPKLSETQNFSQSVVNSNI